MTISSCGVITVGGGAALAGIATLGGVATTVTIDESVAVRLFALPWAVAVFVVVAVKFIWQVYVQVSDASRIVLLLVSPEGPEMGLHLSSTTLTLFKAAVPGLVSV